MLTLDTLIEKAKAAMASVEAERAAISAKDTEALGLARQRSARAYRTMQDALSPEVVIALCEVAKAGRTWRDESDKHGPRESDEYALLCALSHLDDVMEGK